MHIIATNALGYLWDVARIQAQSRGVSFLGNQLFHLPFADDPTLMLELTPQFMEDTLLCLDTFAEATRAVGVRRKQSSLLWVRMIPRVG